MIARPKLYHLLNNFTFLSFFHEFNKKNYIRYECEPGHHLFWGAVKDASKGFNAGRYYITADLEVGKTYVVKIGIYPAVGYSGILPLALDDKKHVNKAVNLVNSKEPVEMSEDMIKELNKAYTEQRINGFKAYNEKYKGNYNIPHMKSDMNLPEEYLK